MGSSTLISHQAIDSRQRCIKHSPCIENPGAIQIAVPFYAGLGSAGDKAFESFHPLPLLGVVLSDLVSPISQPQGGCASHLWGGEGGAEGYGGYGVGH